MMNLKRTEKTIRLALRSGDASFAMAYDKMLSYYSFADSAGNTNHVKIIGMLYNNSKHGNTLRKIALLSNVSESTLLRYREQYVNCFKFYLFHINKNAYKEIASANDKFI